MKNKKKKNTKEIPKQPIRPEWQKILVRITSDANMTRTFMVKTTSAEMF